MPGARSTASCTTSTRIAVPGCSASTVTGSWSGRSASAGVVLDSAKAVAAHARSDAWVISGVAAEPHVGSMRASSSSVRSWCWRSGWMSGCSACTRSLRCCCRVADAAVAGLGEPRRARAVRAAVAHLREREPGTGWECRVKIGPEIWLPLGAAVLAGAFVLLRLRAGRRRRLRGARSRAGGRGAAGAADGRSADPRDGTAAGHPLGVRGRGDGRRRGRAGSRGSRIGGLGLRACRRRRVLCRHRGPIRRWRRLCACGPGRRPRRDRRASRCGARRRRPAQRAVWAGPPGRERRCWESCDPRPAERRRDDRPPRRAWSDERAHPGGAGRRRAALAERDRQGAAAVRADDHGGRSGSAG